MKLVIDAGNTRVKWGVFDQSWLAQGAVAHGAVLDLGAQLQAYPSLHQAIVCSVAAPAVNQDLQSVFDRLGLKTEWISAGTEDCGVINGYKTPAQLGVDRWAALVAAWHLKQAACVVVSAGTALTVDALSAQGRFMGGLIVPGFAMMRGVLAENTAGILSIDGTQQDFPASTGDAVYNGALLAMAGAVERLLARLAQHEAAQPCVLLSGGDAPLLQTALSGASEIVDNLIMQGVLLIAGERLP